MTGIEILGLGAVGTAVLAAGAAAFFYYGNNHISCSEYEYSSKEIPKEFDSMKILHISDFHNTSFPKHGAELLEKCAQLKPDIIFITGDLIDKRRTSPEDLETALNFILSLEKIAPVYYAPGNHEAVSPSYTELKRRIMKTPVTLLENDYVQIERNGEKINIAGVCDPASYYYDYDFKHFRSILSKVKESALGFTVLLSHRPDRIEDYADFGFPLVFSGHAHGGQVRLPFIGGLYAPNQGVLPKYTAGIHHKKNTSLVISRGLGNSRGPVRVFNCPEILSVKLISENK